MPGKTVDLTKLLHLTQKKENEGGTAYRVHSRFGPAHFIILVLDASIKMAAKMYRCLLDAPHGLGILRVGIEALARL